MSAAVLLQKSAPAPATRAAAKPAGLRIGPVDDACEREADRVADMVMAGRTPSPWSLATAGGEMPLRRKCACGGNPGMDGECEECRQKRLQRQALPGSAAASAPAVAPPIVHDVLRSSGQRLDGATRAFLEPRFGHDFSRVRVHTDTRAAASARAVGALAYAVGDDIVFGAGQYAPRSSTGARLLAHELAHVAQQSGRVLRRAPDAKALKEFDDRAAKVRKDPVLAKQDGTSKRRVEEIINETRKRDNALEYMGKLESLFATPRQDPKAQSAENVVEITEAATKNEERLKKPVGTSHQGDEEAVSADATRVYQPRRGRDGSIFQVDARDVTKVAVKVNVHLVTKTRSAENDRAIAQIESLEDAIEKRSSTLGYSLDLTFVKRSGPDVFTIGVDTGAWADAGNVAGGDATFAHELHHLLGLEEDRYDYTTHATNQGMPIPTRIYWFRQELNKVIDNNPESIMNTDTKSPLDDDVCMVIGKRTKTDIAACVKERTDARNKIIEPALKTATGWASKTTARVASDAFLTTGIEPARIVVGMFGRHPGIDRMRKNVAAADRQLKAVTVTDFRLVSMLIDGCEDDALLTPATGLPLELCPQFFRRPSSEMSQALLREAFHLAGVGGGNKDKDCAAADCKTSCGGEQSADTWVRFTKCIAEL